MPIGPIFRSMIHNKTRVILIILEIAVTLAIVTNCVNMINDARSGMLKKSGFDDENLLFVRSVPFRPEFKEQQFIQNHIESDLKIIRSIAGVKSVINTNFLPWQGGGSSTTVKVVGSKNMPTRTQQYFGFGDFCETLGMPLLEGRKFQPGDYQYDQQKDNPKVVIVTEGLANLLFKTTHVVGKQIQDGDSVYTIIGVSGHFYNPYGWPIHEYSMLFPGYVGSFQRGTRFLIRVEPGAMKSVIAALEPALIKSNDGRIVTNTLSVTEVKEQFFSGARLVMRAMGFVIVVLVFVTALGIIGITSLSVSERTRQIGTRRALGATRGDIVNHFLLENWIVTTAGLAIGVIAAYGLNFLLVSNVQGAKMDWRYVAIGMLLLWANGVIATIPPALRGARVSPAIATRSV